MKIDTLGTAINESAKNSLERKKQWVKQVQNANFNNSIFVERDSGAIIGQAVYLTSADLVDGELPFKISRINQNFHVSQTSTLKSFKNFPDWVYGSLIVFDNPLITSLEGITPNIGHILNLSGCSIPSFRHFHKQVEFISSGSIRLPASLESNVLGLLMTKNLSRLVCYASVEGKNPKLAKVKEILNTHLEGDRDVLACQEELVMNELVDFAKL